jgi:uncharacterized ion transporter superfamily protein YfcC
LQQNENEQDYQPATPENAGNNFGKAFSDSRGAKKRSLPSPIAILMIVIMLAAVSTWLLPAGQYHKLALSGQSFIITTGTNDISLPLSQKTLDSLGIGINVEKFTGGDIRKPVSVPGTFGKEKRNPKISMTSPSFKSFSF